ncbi:adenylate/guanylate cyclase domain-containing protein [Labrys miyagiensis]|uniref:adenylate/guanylate cyclase domain-containing protein n=1 Tax=Labrys miyagiensis TaxID=346912 RepID=UPI0024E06ED2|nr:adenylate/guanylate cyclase domain-containing protein [Labrys miyagiensis]
MGAEGGLGVRHEQSVPQSERRQATVLFCDLSDYTVLTAERDPEDTHAILQRFFEAVDTVMAKFGGVVERHIGDNVMGVFGAPLAHDDDPYRAVLAAEEIHRAIASIGEEIGIALSVHIGIASGTVMASHTGSSLKAAYAVVGSVVNLAARIQGLAKAGQTLVSQSVQEATRGMIELEPLGDVSLKGFDIRVPIWRVVGKRRDRDTEWGMPLIGRRGEIRLIGSLLAEAQESGQGKTIYIRGEAGIGKTHLISAAGDLAIRQNFSYHRALILDFGVGQGRDAPRTLIASLINLSPGSSDDDRTAAASRAIEEGLVAPGNAIFLNDMLDIPQTPELQALYTTMDDAARIKGRRQLALDLFRAASQRRPLFLVVEDLHWADQTTLDTMAALAELSQRVCLILAMTSRIDGDPLDGAWRGRVHNSITTIDLGPLRPEEAAVFAEQLRIANSRLVQRCVERAGGNPLFLQQLLRSSEESAVLEDIPATIQSLVLSRMDRLGASDKSALQAAAVAGQRFSLELVRALIGDQAYSPSNLIGHQMVQPEGDELLFSHALVRDGVYSSLTHERRRLLHRASAEFYRRKDPILYAEHLEQAGAAEAAGAYAEAAISEASGYRFDTALALAERGKAIAKAAADCFVLDALLGDYLRETGRASESLEAWQAALPNAPNSADRCRALIGIAAAHRILSRYEPALSALAEAQLLAQGEEQALERAQIHYYRGNIRFAQGDADKCLSEHQNALAAANSLANPEWTARAWSGLGDAHYTSRRMQTALNAFQNCVSICDQHGFGRVALANRIMIGHCLSYLQRTDESLEIIDNAGKIAVLAGNPHAEMFAIQSLVTVLVETGRAKDAREYFKPALSKAQKLGARRYEANILAKGAEVLLLQGEHDEALKSAKESVAICREVGMGFTGAYALAVLAKASNDLSVRSSALLEGEEVLRQASTGHNRIWFYRVASDVYIEERNWDQADRCANELEAATIDEPLPLVNFLKSRIRVLCKAGRGEHTRDVGHQISRLLEQGVACRHDDWLPALYKASAALESGIQA